MNYGLPYKGSKNKLAERIVRLLPKKKNLVDLFCGGCAVSHAALAMGKFEHIHINDLNWMCPTLFSDALAGKYKDDTRWISREDFFRLRDSDPYVAVVWSFGNNMRDYIYSREIEPLKRAIHYAIYFHDYAPGKELGYDLSFIESIANTKTRYIAVKRYFAQYAEPNGRLSGGATQLESLARTRRLSRMPYRCRAQRVCDGSTPGFGAANSKKTNGQARCKAENEPTGCHRLQNRERQSRLLMGGAVDGLHITSSALDYAAVEIPEDSVIYCDIPYEGTNTYNGAKLFDYERFYRWAENQTEPVFISSYNMPHDRFDCVAEWSHRSLMNDKKNIAVTERVFVPKGQRERGNRTPQEMSLFDGMDM